MKKQAHPCKTYAKRSYAHFHMCPHPKTTSKTQTTKDHMHMPTKPRLVPLYVQHLPHVKNKPTPKDHMHMSTKPRLASLYVQHLAFPTCEETSPSLQDICQKILCTLPHVPSPKDHVQNPDYQRSYALSTKPRLASLYVQHLTFPTCEETSPSLQDICQKIICTLPHVKNKPSPKDHMHMSTKPRLASLYVQHLAFPTCEEQANPCKTYAKRSYAHFHMCPHPKTTSKTQTSKDHMHMSTKPRLASLYVQHLPHVKNKLLPKDHMHMSTKPRLASLYVQHFPHVKNKSSPKDHMHMSTKPRLASLYVQHLAFPTCEETSPSLQDICQKIICTLPHVKNKPTLKIICACLQNPD